MSSVNVFPDVLGVAVSPTGANAGYVYVDNFNSNTVSVISPSNTIAGTISGFIVGSCPHGVAVSSTGTTAGDIYVAGGGSEAVTVISPSNTVITSISAGIGSYPYGVAVAP